MNILHYALGFPPYRSGGLTRYAVDLAVTQAKNPDDRISFLYPGSYSLWRSPNLRTMGRRDGIDVFEIDAPNFTPLLGGVRWPTKVFRPSGQRFQAELSRNLETIRPDVLHIHTLMGIPPELIPLAKASGARVVFTTHDYYGICPKTNLIDRSGNVCEGPSAERCRACNRDAQGAAKSFLHSQKIFHGMKPFLRRLVRTRPVNTPESSSVRQGTIEEYEALIGFHAGLLESVDRFHFNSSISESVYRRHFPDISGAVLHVTHAGIRDRRDVPYATHAPLRLGFIGDSTPYKGYPLLRSIMSRIRGRGIREWELHVYGPGHDQDPPQEGVAIHGTFAPSQAASIFRSLDALIVPSIWNETFGFVVLEAVSHGIPVVTMDNVGAKDLIASTPDLLARSDEDLEAILSRILANPQELLEAATRVRQTLLPQSMAEHATAIRGIYGV